MIYIDEAASEKGSVYTPALKLMEKVEKEKEKDAADLAAVAALAEQERQRKKREENKKKSNLELFKEELKRFDIDLLKIKQISISTIYLLNKKNNI